MLTAIKKTLKRLSGKIFIFNPVTWYPKFLEGLSAEFNRVIEFKNNVLNSTVPHTNMYVESIDDQNKKYGIPSTLGGTDAEKICRIIEKASLNGMPGPDWLEEQIQAAGFPLYVIENAVLTTGAPEWGDFEWGDGTLFGLTASFVNPSTIIGELVVSSPPYGVGKRLEVEWGDFEWGDGSEFGTPDLDALNPQPFIYQRTTDPAYWGYYFTLSPIPGNVVTSEADFLQLTQVEFDYLKQIIIELKLLRNWCILQAKVA